MMLSSSRHLARIGKRGFSSAVFTNETISPKVLNVEYAVRGAIVIRAGEIQAEILNNANHSKNFNKVIMCNIGNPQELKQQPLTFHRQVLAGCLYPPMLSSPEQSPFSTDVIDRCQRILNATASNSIGAYTHSQGLPIIRESVCDFIHARDGVDSTMRPDPTTIFLTDGASPGIKNVLQALIHNESDGILTPVPQYPLYSASIALCGGTKVDYFLTEASGWSLEINDVKRAVNEARSKGIQPKAIVIINPGNPTGNVLSEDNVKDVIEFARKENIVILADEVYQENIYGARPFFSFTKVLQSMMSDTDGDKYNHVGIFSFHSVSKGIFGECGLRGGYMQLTNIDASGYEQLYKLASINLCPNTVGQITVDLMCKPPAPTSTADETTAESSFELYQREYKALYESLQRRAKVISEAMNAIDGIDCQAVEGAMYCFPSIAIPEAAVEYATKELGYKCADVFYCMELLEHAGICCVPGSGFGQRDGSYHFRSTILPPEEEIAEVVQKFATFHQEFCLRFPAVIDKFK